MNFKHFFLVNVVLISILYNQYLTVWRLQNVKPICENSYICNLVNGYTLPESFDCREQPCKMIRSNMTYSPWSFDIKDCKLECTTFFECEYKYTPFTKQYVNIQKTPEPDFWRSFIYSLSH